MRARDILVIEDEPGRPDGLASDLTRAGYAVTTADGPYQALGILRGRRFDLVVADLDTPDAPSVETVAALKIIDPDVEVIVGATHATVEAAVGCMKNGALDYLCKPYDLAALRELIARTLDRARPDPIAVLRPRAPAGGSPRLPPRGRAA